MAMRPRQVIRWIVATATLAVIRISGAIPYGWTKALGRFSGLVAYYCVPRIRRVGLANLDRAYAGSLSESEKRRILKSSAQHVATVGLRFAQGPKVNRRPDLIQLTTRGEEHVDAEAGGLLITAHLGTWEYIGLFGSRFGVHGGAIVRPFDDPRVDRAVDVIRRSGGFETIPKEKAAARVFSLVKNGGFAVVLVDQSPRDNAIPTTFFGQRCWSTAAPALIALRTRAPIYPVFVVDEPDGSLRLIVRPRIEWERTGDLRGDLVAITQKCQDAVEEAVREYPEQWLWFHRRWKARPRLEAEWHEKEAREQRRAANL